MKSFIKYLNEKMGDYSSDADYHPEAKLGPKATKKQDTQEISRQKKNLDRLTHEYHKMSKDEGGGGMAQAHGDMFDNAKKAIHKEEVVNVCEKFKTVTKNKFTYTLIDESDLA